MAWTVYQSIDGSAPALSGQVGSLNTILQAILVVGYGAKVAAGWSRPFTSGNISCYLNAAGIGPSLVRPYIQVDDSAAQEARVRGYETMTSAISGINPFLTPTESPLGMYVRKSVTANATARAWVCIADGYTFYLFIETGDFSNGVYLAVGGGGFPIIKVGTDPGRPFIVGRADDLNLGSALPGT